MPTQRERAFKNIHEYNGMWWATAVGHSEMRPETELQALMECAPGQEPDAALEALAPLREILADTIEAVLDDRERWIFDALYTRRLSHRALARELGIARTTVVRVRNRALIKLRTALLEHEEIREYLSA